MGTIRSEGENFFLAEQLSVRSAKPQGHRSAEPRDHRSAEQNSGQTAGSSIPRPYQPDFLFTWRILQPATICAEARMISVPHLTHCFAHPLHTAAADRLRLPSQNPDAAPPLTTSSRCQHRPLSLQHHPPAAPLLSSGVAVTRDTSQKQKNLQTFSKKLLTTTRGSGII